jgi:hypothetical protein
MRTKEEVKALKLNWLDDPCYELEFTEGFEEHHEELLAFRLEIEARWKRDREAKLLKKAEKIGVPGNVTLAAYVEYLEAKIETLSGHLDTVEERQNSPDWRQRR